MPLATHPLQDFIAFSLGICTCYFFPLTPLHKMPLPVTSFEQIGILSILCLLDFNPLKACLLHVPQLTRRNFTCNENHTSLGSLAFQHLKKLSSSVLIKLSANWRRELRTLKHRHEMMD